MRTLLIGGNGFIGSHLVDGLRDAGHDVCVLDPRAPREDVDWSGVTYRRASHADESVLAEALDACDVVLHLASTTVPFTSNANPVYDVSTNLVDTLRLLAAMRSRGMRRILFLSSGGTVYGNPDSLPVGESHPLRPISSYGVVKGAIEQYLLMYQRLGELDPLILRPSNPYGPRQATSGRQGFIAKVLTCLHDGAPLQIWGDGSTVRDYLYIDDLVALVVQAVTGAQCGVYNVGSGVGHSLNEVRVAAEQVVGKSMIVEHFPAQGFDVREIVLDITAANEHFGWRPAVSLEEGLARTWRHEGRHAS